MVFLRSNQSNRYILSKAISIVVWPIYWINSVHCAACSWYKECELKELSMIIDKQ